MIQSILSYFKFKIELKSFNDIVLDKELLSNLRNLTISSYSGMNYEMNNILRTVQVRPVKAHALLAYESNELVGWALLSEEPSDYSFFTRHEGFSPNRDGIMFQVYIHPEHRRKGIGTKLLSKAKRLAALKTLSVCPWDTNSIGFFNNFNNLNKL